MTVAAAMVFIAMSGIVAFRDWSQPHRPPSAGRATLAASDDAPSSAQAARRAPKRRASRVEGSRSPGLRAAVDRPAAAGGGAADGARRRPAGFGVDKGSGVSARRALTDEGPPPRPPAGGDGGTPAPQDVVRTATTTVGGLAPAPALPEPVATVEQAAGETASRLP